MKWINIKEQLPPKNTGVLVTNGKVITAASLDYHKDDPWWWDGHGFGGYEWDFDFPNDFNSSTITHWMTLPDFPTTE